MIPKEAIERAIAGGWRPHNGFDYSGHKITKANKRAGFWIGKNNSTSYLDDYHSALDPTFWRCVRKASRPNWDEGFTKSMALRDNKEFVEIIHEGGDTETFWKEILS